MRCTKGENGARMYVMLNGEILEKVDEFKGIIRGDFSRIIEKI